MPWCPRCDETFPEGPACPRCSARLVERDSPGLSEELQGVADLPMIKVSRRDRRALERLSGPKAPSSRILITAVAALVFAVGFLAGRMGSIEPAGPSVRALPGVKPLMPLDVEGSTAYLLWTEEPLATLAVQNVYSGDVSPKARFTPPFDASNDSATQVVALSGSVALVAAREDRSYVAFVPRTGPAHGWVSGVEAAWSSPEELLVREKDGALVRWAAGTDGVRSRRVGSADRLFQTVRGAVVQRGDRLESISPHRSEAEKQRDDKSPDFLVPEGASVLATDGTTVLLERGGLELRSENSTVPVRLDGFDPLAASFSSDGERLAIVLSRRGEITVAIVDAAGNATLKPVSARLGRCAPVPSWDLADRWIYVAPGDGQNYAVEATGSHVEPVRTKTVGCGVAWLDASL